MFAGCVGSEFGDLIAFANAQSGFEHPRNVVRTRLVAYVDCSEHGIGANGVQPRSGYFRNVFFHDSPQPLAVHVVLRLRFRKLGSDLVGKGFGVCGFGNVVIHLQSNRLKGGLKRRITGEDESHGARLRSTHCTHDCETITRLSDVQIGDQNLELFLSDQTQCLGNRSNGCY
jgi:hypothetical protein